MDISTVMMLGREGVGLIKSLVELQKGIKDALSGDEANLKKAIEGASETLRDKVTELQEKHLELQELALALAEKNLMLFEKNQTAQDELTKLKNFEAQRDQFERVSLAHNTFAYREKALHGSAETQPLLCPNCFDKSQKTYLSFHQHAMYTNEMKCTACSTTVHVQRDEGPAVMVAPRGRRSIDDW